MYQIIGCITGQHDLRLVAIAAFVCAIGAYTTLQMLARARVAQGGMRLGWVGAGGVAFGCFVWAAHFVGMLAYAPGVPMSFDLGLTLQSLILAVCGGWLGLACAVNRSGGAALAAGGIFGGAIGLMHFIGMQALRLPGLLTYREVDVQAAWAVGLLLSPAAMMCFRSGRIAAATVLLVLAVSGLHFIAMAAVIIHPVAMTVIGVDSRALAISVAAVGLLILGSSLGVALLDQYLASRLRLETERFRRFADATFEGLFFLDHGLVSDANAALCSMLGRPAAEILHAPLASFFAAESGDVLRTLQSGQSGHFEATMLDNAGNARAVDILARPLTENMDELSVIAVRDASERKIAEKRIEELSQIDPLTGLANRVLLRRRLASALCQATADGRAVAVLCLDLDRFKAVNDFMGHHAGDTLLAEVAARLRGIVRESDTVGRLGGDEFVVVQTYDGDRQRVVAVAERMVRLLAEPYVIDGNEAEIAASVGIALYPADAAEGETLLRQADLALYRIKHAGGRNFCFFDASMDLKIRARREMEHELRHALASNQLHLEYQPVFDGQTLLVSGYEALLRWNNPRLGNVPPSAFIPLAEECGAILPIGAWVLETACAEAVRWPLPWMIAVNLSPAQFRNLALPANIGALLARVGLDPRRLELEVTEGVLIDDTERAFSILSALKAQGIQISLDDFGTGYASLNYLRRFRFNRLKIDRNFVAELGKDPDADAIVHYTIGLAQTLRLAVTAEGVETDLQLKHLQRMKCSHLQGFLLGRPGRIVQPKARPAVA